jgi:hypothetical protein
VEIRSARPARSVVATLVVGTVFAVAEGWGAVEDELHAFTTDVQDVIAQWLSDLGFPAEVAVAVDPLSLPAAAAAAPGKTAWANVAPVLAAIATGIGVLGFVTFVGGAVQYGRFRAAGLSAEDAVAVVPTQSLVVIGAAALVPAVAVALVFVGLLFLVRVVAGGLGGPPGGAAAPPGGAPAAAAAPSVLAQQGNRVRGVLMFGYMALALGAAYLSTLAPGSRDVLIVLLGLFLALLTAAVARVTDRFTYIAAATLVASGLFLGVVNVVHAYDNSDVRPVAVVRQNKQALIGFFIAEGGNRVYIGRLEFKKARGQTPQIEKRRSRIMAIDKAQISDISIGAPVDANDALLQAGRLADELCDEQLAPATPARQAASATPTAAGAETPRCWTRPVGRPKANPAPSDPAAPTVQRPGP